MKRPQGCGSVAGLEQFYLGSSAPEVTTPLGVAVNQEYRATYVPPSYSAAGLVNLKLFGLETSS